MTLTLEQVAEWLLKQDADLNGRVTVGAIDANLDRCVGVYNDNRASGGQRICIGGAACTRYDYKQVTLLVHWTTNPVTAEKKAVELYESLYGLVSHQDGRQAGGYRRPWRCSGSRWAGCKKSI